jgi:hypothetical protein
MLMMPGERLTRRKRNGSLAYSQTRCELRELKGAFHHRRCRAACTFSRHHFLEAGASRMDLVNCQPRVRPGPFSWPFPNPRRNVTLASPCRQTTFGTYLSHHRDHAFGIEWLLRPTTRQKKHDCRFSTKLKRATLPKERKTLEHHVILEVFIASSQRVEWGWCHRCLVPECYHGWEGRIVWRFDQSCSWFWYS